MSPQSLAELIADICMEEPLDLGELALDEQDARELMASHFCELDRRLLEQGLQAEERLEMMAAIAAHVMVENLGLHLQRLRGGENELAAFHDWMRRHGMR